MRERSKKRERGGLKRQAAGKWNDPGEGEERRGEETCGEKVSGPCEGGGARRRCDGTMVRERTQAEKKRWLCLYARR